MRYKFPGFASHDCFWKSWGSLYLLVYPPGSQQVPEEPGTDSTVQKGVLTSPARKRRDTRLVILYLGPSSPGFTRDGWALRLAEKGLGAWSLVGSHWH